MKGFNIFSEMFENTHNTIKLFIVLLLSIVVYFQAWEVLSSTIGYQNFLVIYSDFTRRIFDIISQNYTFTYKLSVLSEYPGYNMYIMGLPYNSFKYFLIAFIFLFTTDYNKWTSIPAVIITVLLFLSFRAAYYDFFKIYYSDSYLKTLVGAFQEIVYLPMYIIIVFIIKNNRVFNLLYEKLNLEYNRFFKIDVLKIIFMLLVIPAFFTSFLNILYSKSLDYIVYFILSLSNLALHLIGKNSNVESDILILGNNWISLEYACLGIGVLVLIFIIIFCTRTATFNKFVYFIMFSIIYFIFNALRLSALLFYINTYLSDKTLDIQMLHSSITYFMYFVAACGLLVYVFWFGELKLQLKKRSGSI